MDLSKQSLYALRDLAARLGVKAPTACTKTELIVKIEKRKKEMEENAVNNYFINRGRPRKSNDYIGIRQDKSGKIEFFVMDKHLLYDDLSEEVAHLSEKERIEQQVQERVREILEQHRQPVIEDEESRQFLVKAKALLIKLLNAIDKALDMKYEI